MLLGEPKEGGNPDTYLVVQTTRYSERHPSHHPLPRGLILLLGVAGVGGM